MEKDIEQKKEYLCRYREVTEKYKSLKRQEKYLRMRLQGPRTSVLSGTPTGNKHKDISDAMIKLDETLKAVKVAEEMTLQVCADIEKIIMNIPDGIESDIIHMKYIELVSWNDIAEETGYSRRQVYRIHNKILKNLNIDLGSVEVSPGVRK